MKCRKAIMEGMEIEVTYGKKERSQTFRVASINVGFGGSRHLHLVDGGWPDEGVLSIGSDGEVLQLRFGEGDWRKEVYGIEVLS